jgi:predicted permease
MSQEVAVSRSLIQGLRALFRKKALEDDMSEELRGYVDAAYRDHQRAGMSHEDALRAARVELGSVEAVKENIRSAGWESTAEALWQDLRPAARVLCKSRGFTLIAVLTLALGIGANTAIFSLIDAFLLRELPVKDPQQLVLVHRVTAKGGTEDDFPFPAYEQFRDRNRSLSGLFAWDNSTMNVTVRGEPEFLYGDFVTGSYFDVLGVRAALGRTFTAGDDHPGKPTVAVISDAYWKRRFAQDPAALGTPIYVGGTAFTVIGVTPPTFYGRNVAGRSPDLMLPMFVHPGLALKDHDTFNLMGRLRPGISAAQAQADLNVIYQQALAQAAGSKMSPEVERDIRAQSIQLKPGLRGEGPPSDNFAAELRILMCVVGVALLIASVNVANLSLARAASRQKEIAIRLAIGASRGRVTRQLLAESVLLAVTGGALGFLLAKWGVGGLVTLLSLGRDPFPFDLKPDPAILAFTAAVSLVTGIVLGSIPAFAVSRADLNPILKGASAATESRPARRGLGKSLVVSQVALSLALLIGAGLLIRTLRKVYSIDTGFERDRMLFAWVFPALSGYDHAREMNLYRDLLTRLNSTPGVQATLSRYRQFVARPEQDAWVQGANGGSHTLYYNLVAPRFFRTMGVGQLLGRDFAPTDSETSPKVVIISESAALLLFPGQNPIGKRVGLKGPDSAADIQVIGVVRDTQHHLLDGASLAAIYVPYTQGAPDDYGQMNLVVRSTGDPDALIPMLRRQVQSVDKNMALRNVETPAADLDEYLGNHRSLTTLLTLFAALALALASIGLYGTMSYTVGQRTRELGIRAALGAQRSDMLRMVLGETFALVALGAAIGIPLAMASEKLLQSMLFGVKTTDPLTIAAALLIMLATALLAGFVPARRATHVDPMVALRQE